MQTVTSEVRYTPPLYTLWMVGAATIPTVIYHFYCDLPFPSINGGGVYYNKSEMYPKYLRTGGRE